MQENSVSSSTNRGLRWVGWTSGVEMLGVSVTMTLQISLPKTMLPWAGLASIEGRHPPQHSASTCSDRREDHGYYNLPATHALQGSGMKQWGYVIPLP